MRLAVVLTVTLALAMVLARLLSPLADRYRDPLSRAASAYLDTPVTIGGLRLDWWGWGPVLTLTGLRAGDPGHGPALRAERLLIRLDAGRSLRAGRLVWQELRLTGGELDAALPPPLQAELPDWRELLGRLATIEQMALDFRRLRLRNPDGPELTGKLHLEMLHDRLTAELETGNGQRLRADLGIAPSGELHLRGRDLRPAEWSLPPRWRPAAGTVGFDLEGAWEQDGLQLALQGRLHDPLPPAGTGFELLRQRLQRLPDWRFELKGYRRGGVDHWQAGLQPRGGSDRTQTDVRIELDRSADGRWRGRMAGARVEDLAAFASPWLGSRALTLLAAQAPSGKVPELRFEHDPQAGAWQLSGRFADVGTRAQDRFPGLTGLTGTVHLDRHGGRLEFDSRATRLDWALLRAPVGLDRVDGSLSWRRTADGWHVEPALNLSNPDLRAELSGSVALTPGASPRLDLTAAFGDVPVERVAAYLPVAILDPELVDWLDRALVSGQVPQGRMVLKGRAADFPFDTAPGEFSVDFRVSDMRLDYRPDWPGITALNAAVRFHGRRCGVTADRGRIMDTELKQVTARIDDLGAALLVVDGSAQGSAAGMLRFVQTSPLRHGVGRYLDKLRIDGDSDLDLNLAIALEDRSAPLKVQGAIDFGGNDITLVQQDLTLADLRGRLAFDNAGLRAKDLQFRLGDQSLSLDLRSTDALALQASARGRLSVADLAGSEVLAPYLEGHSNWSIDLEVPRTATDTASGYRLRLRSDLSGTTVRLPGSLAKAADAVRPLTLDARLPDDRGVQLSIGYGDAVTATLTLDGARRLTRLEAQAGRLALAGQPLGPLKVRAWQESGQYSAELDGPRLHGRLAIPDSPSAERPVWLALDRLRLSRDGDASEAVSPTPGIDDPRRLPPFNLSVAGLYLDDRPLGQLTLLAVPDELGYNLADLQLNGDRHRLQVRGHWRLGPQGAVTHLQAGLHSAALGETLAALGLPAAVEQAESDIGLVLNWPGAPNEFRLAAVNGELDLALGQGRLVKVEPGLGRLLGLVSLTSLTRRMQLDFSDLAQEGLAFDRIAGRVHLAAGQAELQRLALTGPALELTATGRIGLVAHDLDLHTTVNPQIGSSLAIAGTLAGGPAVGAAVLLADQVLQADKLVGLEYAITGSWQAPQVERLTPLPITPATGSNRK